MSSTISSLPGPYIGPDVSSGKLPKDKFIVRTILHSNMTIIHNKVEAFKSQLEDKLTRAYRRAYDEDKFPRYGIQCLKLKLRVTVSIFS